MYLRGLEEKDAPLMLEWMHDIDIKKSFRKNFQDVTLADVCDFCENAKIPIELTDGQSIHYAIIDDSNEYLGTISLKEIDLKSMSAEYAISLRKGARGKGIAFVATGLILEKAFYEWRLRRVYLNVYGDNISAVKLYERSGFRFEGEFR